jgi:Flp pilus assembly protein TadG
MRRTRSTSGASAVEFAIILLPFCLLLMGMIDYGWYFFVDLACTNAVREGARVATTYPGACPNAAATTAGVAAVGNYVSGLLPPSYSPSVTATCTTANGSPQFNFVLTLVFPQLTGFSYVALPGGGYGGNVTVQTSATMRGVQ